MEQRTCPACGEQFTPSTSTQRACPPTTEDRARAKGQPRSKCARKLYNAAQRGVPVVPGTVGDPFDCAQCGTHCEPGANVAPHATKFCGATCKATWHRARTGPTRQERAAAALVRAIGGKPSGDVWYAHVCPECGTQALSHFKPREDNGYCSSTCRLRQKRRRRRARTAGAGYKTLSFRAVAVRDNWTCQLCGDPVDSLLPHPDPRSPTLDHIIPLSQGGEHSEANGQLAHFICNSLKGDGTSATSVGTQLAMV